MNFDITPLQGIGQLSFGMTAEDVRRHFGSSFTSFKKTPSSPFPCDYFKEVEVFAYYKLPGVLEAVEFAEPANPLLYGKRLMGLAAQDAWKILAAYDPAMEIDSDGVISHKLGVGLYAPGWEKDANQVVESVIAFEEGYYE